MSFLDYLKDCCNNEALFTCSLEARGLLMEMVITLGTLEDDTLSMQQVARVAGVSVAKVRKLAVELAAAGFVHIDRVEKVGRDGKLRDHPQHLSLGSSGCHLRTPRKARRALPQGKGANLGQEETAAEKLSGRSRGISKNAQEPNRPGEDAPASR